MFKRKEVTIPIVETECRKCGTSVNDHEVFGDSCYTMDGWGPYCEECRDKIDAQILAGWDDPSFGKNWEN